MRTSARARRCLLGLVLGFLAIVSISGATGSPLVTPLPPGAEPPGWTHEIASALGLAGLGRTGLSILSWTIVAVLVGAFVALVREANHGRVRPAAALWAAMTSLAMATAAPMLLSRDIISYATYARLAVVYGRNPYLVVPATIRPDPFLMVTSRQWFQTRSLYGPAFTRVSELIVRMFPHSPGSVILAFKSLAGLAVAIAVVLVAWSVGKLRPGRVALAVVLVGLNPVIVIHTVGGGHVDALLAATLAGALAFGVAAQRAVNPRTRAAFEVATTTVLTLACLTRILMLPVLILWLWWVLRSLTRARIWNVIFHLAIVMGLSVAIFEPFLAGWRTLSWVATLGGIETWASPVSLIANPLRDLIGAIAGDAAGNVVYAAVVGAFAISAVFLLRRLGKVASLAGSDLVESAWLTWGPALLLIAMSTPYFLPWYAAWFVPFLALMPDDGFMWTGVAACGVLVLTLIPADPWHGYTSWEVMTSAHFVAAPLMLVLLIGLWIKFRALTADASYGAGYTSPGAPNDD